MLPTSAERIMDIGCGTGATAAWLAGKFQCEAYGVESHPESRLRAAAVISHCYAEDAETDGQYIDQHQSSVDLLLLLDVLEHLQNPWARLESFRSMLTQDGCVIASIPNIRNVKVLLPLIFKGQWKYQSSGILDRTHLRFFTRSSVLELFEGSGFQVKTITATGPVTWSQISSLSGLVVYLLNKLLLGGLEGFIAHQYLIKAVTNNTGTSQPV